MSTEEKYKPHRKVAFMFYEGEGELGNQFNKIKLMCSCGGLDFVMK